MNAVDQSAANYQEFVQSLGAKFVNSQKNRDAIIEVVTPILEGGGVVTVPDFLSVWLSLTAEAKLEEPLTEAELKAQEEQRIQQRNKRLEEKDRRSGATFVGEDGKILTRHLTDAEREEMQAKARAESKTEYDKAVAWIRGKAEGAKQSTDLGPSPLDAQNALQAILAPVTVSTATKETKSAVTRWMRDTSSEHVRIVRRNNPEAATKMDRILLKTFEADI